MRAPCRAHLGGAPAGPLAGAPGRRRCAAAPAVVPRLPAQRRRGAAATAAAGGKPKRGATPRSTARSTARTAALVPPGRIARPADVSTEPQPQPQLPPRTASAANDASPASAGGATSWSGIVGAVALITGSTVGAGMLALPAATAPAGFLPTAGLLGGCWVILLLEALLLAEVTCEVGAQLAAQRAQQLGGRADAADEDSMVTLRQMAEATLGRAGSVGVTCTYLALSMGLLVAYISKSGEALHMLSGARLDEGLAMVLAAGGVGGLLTAGGASAADAVNRVLTFALLALFGCIMAGALPAADLGGLADGADWGAAPGALPIVWLTLVFHDLVPVVCQLLRNDRAAIRTALVLGSALPLAMFLAWEVATLGAPGGADALVAAGGDPLALLMTAGGPAAAAGVQAFSLLAVGTSFVGTALGVSETLKTELPLLLARAVQPGSGAPPLVASRARTAAAANALPLLLAAGFALHNPGSFLSVLSAVGAYGMTVLYGLLPPLMAWRLRVEAAPRGSTPSGAGGLAALAGCAAAVGLVQADADARAALAGHAAVVAEPLAMAVQAVAGGDQALVATVAGAAAVAQAAPADAVVQAVSADVVGGAAAAAVDAAAAAPLALLDALSTLAASWHF